jgi:hypothetical protein
MRSANKGLKDKRSAFGVTAGEGLHLGLILVARYRELSRLWVTEARTSYLSYVLYVSESEVERTSEARGGEWICSRFIAILHTRLS